MAHSPPAPPVPRCAACPRRARDRETGEVCALKKVKLEKERDGFPLTSVREINVLLSLAHPNIVNVSEVVVGSSLDSVFMVMEYADHDLKSVMERRLTQPFSTAEVKCLMRQLLAGTAYLHHNWVLHRDLKTSNILYTNAGQLKICDFGLARQYGSPLKPYTHLVVTLWYRAPELLLGEPSSLVTRRAVCVLCVSGHRKRAASTRAALFCVLFFSWAEGASAVWPARPPAGARTYSTAVDVWSCGCILAELLLKGPLFAGKNELAQIDQIFKTLGTPTPDTWPGARCPLLAVIVAAACSLVRPETDAPVACCASPHRPGSVVQLPQIQLQGQRAQRAPPKVPAPGARLRRAAHPQRGGLRPAARPAGAVPGEFSLTVGELRACRVRCPNRVCARVRANWR